MKIDLDEIGDGAMQDAVGDVAGGAAEEKGEASSMKRADIVAGDEQPSNDSDDDEGAADEKYAQGGRGETGEKTEGDAGITGINEIEEIVNDRVREAVSGAGFDPRFCGAVEEDDGESDPEEAEAVGKSHEVKEEKEEEEVKETGKVNILGHRDACRSVAFDLPPDRKSTRLNSSHVEISYAVFCLKKKKKKNIIKIRNITKKV